METKIESRVTARTTYRLDITDEDLIKLLRAAGYKIPSEATVWTSSMFRTSDDKSVSISVSWG